MANLPADPAAKLDGPVHPDPRRHMDPLAGALPAPARVAMAMAADSRNERRRIAPAEQIDYQVTPGFVALLERLDCSLVISNQQPSTAMCFSSPGDGRPAQMFARLPAAIGLAVAGDRLAVAARTEVIVFTNVGRLAPSLPKLPNLFDGYFVPRVRYTVGESQIHDMAFCGAELLAVNTRYSCICRLDGFHNFVPVWQPPFISAIAPGDRCHQNGMALKAGAVRYATALGATDSLRGWTGGKLNGDVLMEVPNGRVLTGRLCMLHSPRLIGERLNMIEAGTGTLIEIDRTSGARRDISGLPGFARGLAEQDGYLFAGLSSKRGTRPFEGLSVEHCGREIICGVVAVEAATSQTVGALRYIGGCSETHDLQVVPGVRRLGIWGDDTDTHAVEINLPDAGFWLEPPLDE